VYSGDRRVLTIKDEPGALLSTALAAARPELAAAASTPFCPGLRRRTRNSEATRWRRSSPGGDGLRRLTWSGCAGPGYRVEEEGR